MSFLTRYWRQPQGFDVFAPVADAAVPALRADLARCAGELRLEELPMVHTVRLFVIEAGHDLRGNPLRACLVLSAVFDGDARRFLAAWVGIAGSVLLRLLRHCDDAPADAAQIATFLIARSEVLNTLHIGSVGSTAEQVREEASLAAALRDFVDRSLSSWGPDVSAERVRAESLAFVRSHLDLPQRPRPGLSPWRWVLQRLDLALGLSILTFVPVIAALTITWALDLGVLQLAAIAAVGVLTFAASVLLLSRLLEVIEPDVVVRQDDRRTRLLVESEDYSIQNQFTMLAPVRDSVARRLLVRLTLFLSDSLSKHWWNEGKLVGVETIHFARIHLIDRGRRFLFISDFDGSWERYLFDFLSTGKFAVIPNWANLLGCPKTRFLLEPSLGFGQRFLPFTRARQLRTDVWYSAFPELAVTDILINAKIREGLFSRRRGRFVRRWVRLL